MGVTAESAVTPTVIVASCSFLGSCMPYRSLRAAARRCVSIPVGNSFKFCLAASVHELECFFLLCAFQCQIRSALARALQTFKEFPTGIETQRLAAALRDLYGIQEPFLPESKLQICHFVVLIIVYPLEKS